jgi:hypothetical protein
MTASGIAAALGFRAHSGWAAAVAVSAAGDVISVHHRWRLELVEPGPGAVRQPFHDAEGEPLARAEAIVARSTAEARRLAVAGFEDVIGRLRARGLRPAGCGLLLASGRSLPDLPAILASHALIHAAEGELFREAIRRAAAECSLPVTAIAEREVWTALSEETGRPARDLQARVASLAKITGPPWRQDEKLATAAALLALAKVAPPPGGLTCA